MTDRPLPPNGADPERDEAEVLADRVRDELLLTLRELDRRRHQAFDLRTQFVLHRQQLVTAGGVLAGGLGLLLGAFAWRAHHNRTRKVLRRKKTALRQKRVEGVRRAWTHPERLARQEPEERSFFTQVLNKVALALAVGVGSRLARRTVVRLVPVSPAPPTPMIH